MLYDMESNYIGIWKFVHVRPLERDNMYEEARANLLALANELEVLGEDGQAEICRDAAKRLPVEIRTPLPNHSITRGKQSLLYFEGFVPQYA